MSKSPKTPRSPEQLNSSVGSAVARAAIKRSGAGVHGGSAKAQNRRDRQRSRRILRQDLGDC
jgi:hypothetical protein